MLAGKYPAKTYTFWNREIFREEKKCYSKNASSKTAKAYEQVDAGRFLAALSHLIPNVFLPIEAPR